jgi:hypothetical protein
MHDSLFDSSVIIDKYQGNATEIFGGLPAEIKSNRTKIIF